METVYYSESYDTLRTYLLDRFGIQSHSNEKQKSGYYYYTILDGTELVKSKVLRITQMVGINRWIGKWSGRSGYEVTDKDLNNFTHLSKYKLGG